MLSTYLQQGGRWERDKLGRRRSTKLRIPPSSDARPLVYHTNRQALSVYSTIPSRGSISDSWYLSNFTITVQPTDGIRSRKRNTGLSWRSESWSRWQWPHFVHDLLPHRRTHIGPTALPGPLNNRYYDDCYTGVWREVYLVRWKRAQQSLRPAFEHNTNGQCTKFIYY